MIPLGFQVLIGTFLSTLPLVFYIAFFEDEDDGRYLGSLGQLSVALLRINFRGYKWKLG